jgi:hypothetical protein
MRLNALLIVSLLVIFIAAPIVDAVACDDCKDIIALLSDDGRPAQQESDTAQDLCPVCANTAVAMGNTCCGAPSLISQAGHHQQMLALSAPSYPINKPPQN